MPAKKTIVNKIREHQQLLEEHGRVPPQAPELEESVLGAILIDPAALGDVIDILKPDVFYKEAHYYIFQAITELYQSSNSIDVLTVVQQLRKNGKLEAAGGAAYIAQLTRKVLSSANVEYHSRIILQKFIQRELIRISSETIKMAYDDTIDVFDLLNNAEEKLFSISEGHLRQGTVELPKLLNQARENIDIARKNTTGLTVFRLALFSLTASQAAGKNLTSSSLLLALLWEKLLLCSHSLVMQLLSIKYPLLFFRSK